MATTKNGAVTPAAYVAPAMELVEMGVESAMLVTTSSNLEDYETGTWN